MADQPLVSVETDKAVVEVPAPWSGTVAKLYGQPGEMLKVGAPLVDFDEGERADSGSVVGKLESEEPSKPAAKAKSAAQKKPPARTAKVKIAPAVRRKAAELGIDLSAISGSGPGGAILSADLDVAGAKAEPAALDEGWEQLRGVRRAMARGMTAALAVPRATVTEEADVSHWQEDAAITLLLVEAMLAAIAAEPALNASFDGEREARRVNPDPAIGIAVDTPDGLIVPVLRVAADEKPEEIRTELRRLIEGAHARSLKPADLRGATITLSNFGAIGGLFAELVVSPPQVAILGAGRTRGGLMPLSLSFDHRAVSGGEAARFINAVKAHLERKP
jgi:pyruvate dehydrogenase E2 component (dihydrolipoamide acetyltransferase)